MLCRAIMMSLACRKQKSNNRGEIESAHLERGVLSDVLVQGQITVACVDLGLLAIHVE